MLAIVIVLLAAFAVLAAPSTASADERDNVCMYYRQVNVESAVEMLFLEFPAWFYHYQWVYMAVHLPRFYQENPNPEQWQIDYFMYAQWNAALSEFCTYST
jgi:hypothetical protein